MTVNPLADPPPTARQTHLRGRFTGPPLQKQRLSGSVFVRVLARSVDAKRPATWALGLWVIWPDDTTLAELVPFTIGPDTDRFPSDALRPYVIGPVPITAFDCPARARWYLEVGSAGEAIVQVDDSDWVVAFSNAVETKPPAPTRHRRVDRCIYCPATHDLSREHIVPEALNGEWTLTKASCQTCRNITSRFELDVLRKAFGHLRVSLGMRTKHPQQRPTELPIRVTDAGVTRDLLVPVADYPAVMSLPRFAPPGTQPRGENSVLLLVGPLWLRQVAGPPFTDVLQRIQREGHYDAVTLRVDYSVVDFARMVAKIAYGFAVLQLGLDAIAVAYVLPAIRGDASNLWRWIGCDSGDEIPPADGLHECRLETRGDEIHVFVRVFAQFGAPEYHVIVGRMTDYTLHSKA